MWFFSTPVGTCAYRSNYLHGYLFFAWRRYDLILRTVIAALFGVVTRFSKKGCGIQRERSDC